MKLLKQFLFTTSASLIFTVLEGVLYAYHLDYLKIIPALLVIPAIYYLFCRLAFTKCLLSVGLLAVLTAVGNMAATAFFKAYGIEMSKALHDQVYMLYGAFITASISFTIIIILKTLKLIPKLPKELKPRILFTNLISLLFIIALIYLDFINTMLTHTNIILHIVHIGLSLSYFLFFIYIFNTIFELDYKRHELENQLFYNNNLETILEDLRRFKHNYSSVLSVIMGYVRLKKLNELENYLIDISEDFKNSFSQNGLFDSNIKNAGLLGILTAANEKAEELGVKFSVCSMVEIKQIEMKMHDLYEVLGILFNNAIEAAATSDKKTVDFTIRNSSGCLTFSVSNSFKEKPDINQMISGHYTTKGLGRGNGLRYLNMILKKYNNISFKTEFIGDMLLQSLIFKQY